MKTPKNDIFEITEDFKDGNIIKANVSGLRRFAGNLNQIADEMENNEALEFVLMIGDKRFNWANNEFPIQGVIKPTDTKEPVYKPETIIEHIKSIIIKLGCGLLAIIFLLCFFAGLQTIYNWFF